MDDLNTILHLAGLPTKELLTEKSPPGFKGTVKAMKKHHEIDNPWALSWWMKNKGYHSHRTKSGKKKRNESQVAEVKLLDLGSIVDQLLSESD